MLTGLQKQSWTQHCCMASLSLWFLVVSFLICFVSDSSVFQSMPHMAMTRASEVYFLRTPKKKKTHSNMFLYGRMISFANIYLPKITDLSWKSCHLKGEMSPFGGMGNRLLCWISVGQIGFSLQNRLQQGGGNTVQLCVGWICYT
mmetsp:Transcript_2205/g.4800  ORF Transcript_2205/g.4800 Transcript_2205/m.4800 type:complete len:145 (+) Transcript_2205:831-1265(+)